jgi:Zn-dependent membrane protease YugP
VVPTHHSRGVIGSITHAVVAVAPTWVAHQVTHAAKWVAHRFVAAYHWMSDELGIWVNLNFPSLFSGKYGVGTVIVSLLVGVVGLGLFALFILFGYRRARRDRSEKALERLRQETIKQRQEAKNDKKAA